VRAGRHQPALYLSTPPSLYADIVTNLGKAGRPRSKAAGTRIIIESRSATTSARPRT